jgi:hypothetical protein
MQGTHASVLTPLIKVIQSTNSASDITHAIGNTDTVCCHSAPTNSPDSLSRVSLVGKLVEMF